MENTAIEERQLHGGSSNTAEPHNPSCALCQKRNIDCDRGKPCSNCSRHRFECFYWNEVTKRPVFYPEGGSTFDQGVGTTFGHGVLNGNDVRTSYPEPRPPTFNNYSSFPQSVVPGAQPRSDEIPTYGVLPGSQGLQSNDEQTPTAFGWSTATRAEDLNEAQFLARQFHTRHGDPGANTVRLSTLPGQYADAADGGPGRDGARHAWRQAITYSNTHEYDEDFDVSDIDGTENLLEEAERPSTRGGTSRGRGRGRGGWRRLLKGTEHENVGRSAMPNPRAGRPKGSRGGRRSKPIDVGHEFRGLMQSASQLFFDKNYESAADNCRQAIGINPEIFQAHSLLSAILEQQGRHADSIQALKFGAVTIRSAEVWETLALKILASPHEHRSQGLIRDAIDCYGEAVKVTKPEDQFELRAKKYELQKQLSDSRGARLDCKNILRMWPHKTYFVREFAQLCAAWRDRSELKKAFDEYDAAFKVYENEETFGDEDDPTDAWDHLNTYLELAEMVGDPWTGIHKAKQISRWFLGRREETFWERYSADDREFDLDNERRAYVPEWQMGKASRDNTQYGEGMPIEIRIRLGMFRLKMGLQHHQEALRHFRPLLQEVEAIEDFWEVFLQVAQALRGAGFLKEAAEFYDPLRSMPDAVSKLYGLDEKTWMALGTCYHAIRRYDDAIACYEVVVGRHEENYGRASANLAKLYEDKGELDKARFICNEFISIGRHDLLVDAGVQMVPDAVRKLPAKIPFPQHIPSGKVTPAIKPRIPRAPPKPILPAGVASTSPVAQLAPAALSGATRKSSSSGKPPITRTSGPTSMDFELPPEPKSRITAGRSRLKRKRDQLSVLEAISGQVEDPELFDEASKQQGPDVTRPRLTKKPKPLSKATEKEQSIQQRIHDTQTRVHAYYTTVKVCWKAARAGMDDVEVEKWMDAALGMLGDFAAMKVFFPYRDRNVANKADEKGDDGKRLQDSPAKTRPQGFLMISFGEWHRIFVDLALFYARNAEQDKCYRILQDVLFGANVFFQKPKLKWTQYAAALHCAYTFNDSQYLIELSREIIKEGECRSGEGYQLLAAVNRLSFGSNWFSAGPTQKFMLRQVKALDYLAMTPERRKHFDWSAQAPPLQKRSERPVEEPADLNAGVLLTYGHMVAVANHSFSSLPYYYRALALQPENICVNLSIATMWVQNSMKRQVPNRQFGISQGLAFLYRYYDLRVASGKVCHLQEAEYNTARMWHYLGLTHLAVPAYENVLGLSQQVQVEARQYAAGGEDESSVFLREDGTVVEGYQVEDYAQEAALALQGMYSLTGNMEAARAVAEDWLVI